MAEHPQAQSPDPQPSDPIRGGLAKTVGGDQFSVAEAIGGPRGVAESVIPTLLFIITFTVTENLRWALVLAVGASALAVLARLVMRSPVSQAVSGAIGVGICALFALRSGEARDFYLPGFLINAGYGTACLLSLIPVPKFKIGETTLRRGPYPLLGLLLGPLLGEGLAWRNDPRRVRFFSVLTLCWAAFFWLKVVVQVPLYLAGQLEALGIAKIAMGVPAYAFMCYLTWLAVRRARA